MTQASETVPRKRKTKSEKELLDDKTYQADYYEQNRKELLAKKAARYAENPDYRRGIQNRARRRHWLGDRLDNKEFPPFGELKSLVPKAEVPLTVKNKKDVRHGETIKVRVYTAASLAYLLGRDPQILRLWWKRGQLPEPALRAEDLTEKFVRGRNPRLFTHDEMVVLDKHKELLNLPSRGKTNVIFTETVQAEFDQMCQGLKLKPKE